MSQRICSVDGCDKVAKCRNMCKSHYERWRYNARRVERSCVRCGVTFLVGTPYVKAGSGKHCSYRCWSADNRRNRTSSVDGTCSVDGCVRSVHARGYCGMHYQRVKHHGSPGPAESFRSQPGDQCVVDGCERKPRQKQMCDMHYQRLRWTGDVGPPGKKVQSRKGVCMVDQCSSPIVARRLCKRHYHIECKYGISVVEHSLLWAVQGERCAICARTTPTLKGWVVDHCHISGTVRGILCSNCNAGIGFLQDQYATVVAAVDYLKKWSHLKEDAA